MLNGRVQTEFIFFYSVKMQNVQWLFLAMMKKRERRSVAKALFFAGMFSLSAGSGRN